MKKGAQGKDLKRPVCFFSANQKITYQQQRQQQRQQQHESS